MGHFHLWGLIKPRIWTYVITCKLVIAETLHSNKEWLARASPSSTVKVQPAWGLQRALDVSMCHTHNNSVVETSPERDWDHQGRGWGGGGGRGRGRGRGSGGGIRPFVNLMRPVVWSSRQYRHGNVIGSTLRLVPMGQLLPSGLL